MIDSPMDTETQKQAGEDVSVSGTDDLTVLTASMAYKHEAEQARRTRIIKNRKNRAAYMGERDWSHKSKGQSREHLPKVAMAIEQFSAFFKKALTGYGDYFQVEGPLGDPIAPHVIRKILMAYLEDCGPNEDTPDFATIVSDGVKTGSLESLVIFKVHGCYQRKKEYSVQRGLNEGAMGTGPVMTENLGTREVTPWKLRIELVRPDDYYPDPTGRGLYEIHSTEQDLSHVIEWAESGYYDLDAVDQITEEFHKKDEDEQLRETLKGQDTATPPSFRKTLVIDEYYGTILDSKGHVVERKAFWAIANEKWLIRKPRPLTDLFWHGESPLVAVPLVRVPGSVWHKALADNMTPIGDLMDELVNLIFDGGLASVWGTRQIRLDWLENPQQVADGVPQGATLSVSASAPADAKVLEQVTTGAVPQEAMAVFGLADREFLSASLSNELNLGQLPSKQVKATEIVEASTSRAVTIDGLVRDTEKGISKVIRLAWLTLLQHADDLATDDIIAAIGPRAALTLARMSPAERFSRYASTAKFKVYGLSAVLARTQDFQKLAALLGLISTNPLMLQAFLAKYSLEKTLDTALKYLNISPDGLMADEMEMAKRPDLMAQMPMMMQLTGVKKTGGEGVPGMVPDGGGGIGAQANQQMTNPLAAAGI